MADPELDRLPRVDPQAAQRLRSWFDGIGFSVAGLTELFATDDPPIPSRFNLPAMLARMQDPTPRNVAARWFVAGQAVPREVAALGVGPQSLADLQTLGLLREYRNDLVPTVMLIPFAEYFVASDLFQRLAGPSSFDYVLPINPTARHLWNFTIREPAESALDLCTGCGVHALGLADRCRRVIATDLNARAVAIAQFNAAFNGFENVDCRSGDGMQPVRGETFEHIVCNPPFVLSPRKEFLYRDNDQVLDGFCRQLVEQAPAFLRSGGYFQMIFEWVETSDATAADRLQHWVEHSGCDALVLRANLYRPETYAEQRVHEMLEETGDAGRIEQEIARWIDFYREAGVRAIHGGLLALRKRAGANWFHFQEKIATALIPYGDLVGQSFRNRDFLEAVQDSERLGTARLIVGDHVELLQKHRIQAGRWSATESVIQATRGWLPPFTFDPDGAQILAQFDGEHTVDELTAALADRKGLAPQRLIADFQQVVRQLLEMCVLRPAAAPAD